METLWSQRAWQEKTATRTLGKEGSYEAIAEVCIKMCGSGACRLCTAEGCFFWGAIAPTLSTPGVELTLSAPPLAI